MRADGTASIADDVVQRWFTPGWAAAQPDVVARLAAMVAGTSDDGNVACCEAATVERADDATALIADHVTAVARS